MLVKLIMKKILPDNFALNHHANFESIRMEERLFDKFDDCGRVVL